MHPPRPLELTLALGDEALSVEVWELVRRFAYLVEVQVENVVWPFDDAGFGEAAAELHNDPAHPGGGAEVDPESVILAQDHALPGRFEEKLELVAHRLRVASEALAGLGQETLSLCGQRRQLFVGTTARLGYVVLQHIDDGRRVFGPGRVAYPPHVAPLAILFEVRV